MAYTALKLISNAFYTSGVVSPEFQTMSAIQATVGLDLLNEALTDKTVEDDMIPYFLKYTFNTVPSQNVYFIPNLIQIDTLVFFINSVRYRMNEQQRRQFFGSSRAERVESLPFNWEFERQLGGGNLNLYFTPDSAYPMEAWGLFRLSPIAATTQNLSLTFDDFYISYLKYCLTEKICAFYDYVFPDGPKAQLEKYEHAISKRSQKIDLSREKISTLTQSSMISYAQVNLSPAWTP